MLVRDLLKQWLFVVAAAIIVGACAYIYTDVSYVPLYRTSTTLVVTSRSSNSTVFSNLSTANSLATVFTEVLNSSVMRKIVLEEAELSNFDGYFTASCIAETNLLTLSVEGTDPRACFLVMNSVINNHEELTSQIIGNVVLDVLQNPVVPTAPINAPNSNSRMRLAMIAAALGTSVLIVYISYNRDAVRSAKEARKKLDCHFLGEIPHEHKYKTLRKRLKREKTGIVISNPTTSFHFAENIRKLRRRIEQRMGAGRVLVVTSVMENEGKSTVAVNIALSMKQKYDRVLLLESDLRKPAVHTVMQQRDFKVTVKDVLLGGSSPAEAVIQDRNTGLYMILDSKGIRNPGDILSSSAMNDLIQWTREHFDVVIVDLPPMSVASDAESVLEFADSCLLVVRQNVVKADALNRAIAAIKRGKAKLIGCVLNNVYSSFLSSGQGVKGGYYGKYKKYGKYGVYTPKKTDL